jgi:hypothetical protein
MKRPLIIVASVLTLLTSPPLLSVATTSAVAQEEWSGADMRDGDLRDLLRNWVRDHPDRRDMLTDLVRKHRERRADLTERSEDRRDRRDWLRDRMPNRWDDDEDGSWRGRADQRDRFRERVSENFDEDDGGRLRDRLAERRGGSCYFLTRSLRDEEGNLMVIVRRRTCRD